VDLITKAVERAQEERQSGVARQTLLQRSGPQGLVVPEIEYTHTKVIPVSLQHLRANRVVTAEAPDEELVPYKMLRTRVLQRMRDQGWSSLAVTSANAGEGKTLTAVNLSISLAMEVSCTVLLVDLDLMRPSVHKLFGLPAQPGIRDYLVDGTPLDEVLVHPAIPRLVLLPGGSPLRHSSEMLSSPRMVQLAEELKTRYARRIVVFDLPPLLASDDAIAFAPCVDAALLVVEEGKTQIDDVARTAELLQNVKLLGTVLNKAEHVEASYY
jgi:protein-tyrosine kinase